MKLVHYKAIMHAQFVTDIVESNYNSIDKSEIFKQAYELMIDNEGYDLDVIIEIMMEEAQVAQEEQEEQEEHSFKSTVDPAFASWEDCNSQFV